MPVKVHAKRNYLPAKECSTPSYSDIPSDRLSELFLDTYAGKWGDSDEEPMREVQECRILSAVTTNVEIKMPADSAPLVSISWSVKEDSGVKWVPKARPIAPLPKVKPDDVSGCSVQCATNALVLPGYRDSKTLPRLSSEL